MLFPGFRRRVGARAAYGVLSLLLLCLLAACGSLPTPHSPAPPKSASGVLVVQVTMGGTPLASGGSSPTRPVAGAEVTILTMSGQTAETLTTDAAGIGTASLPPGTYWVVEPTLHIVGRLPQKHVVTIVAGGTTELSITLEMGASGTTRAPGLPRLLSLRH